MVIRVEKSKDYTVMGNYHLRDRELSLKAKGLLSLMLSLPDDWDYSVTGLSAICKESVDTIKSTLKELKACGYMIVKKLMPNETKSGRIEYVYDIFEKKQEGKKQEVEIQPLEIQAVETQAVVFQPQLNTNKQNTNKSNTKHTYGEFKKVRLTDDELKKLKDKFPSDWETRIATLDEYIARTGKRYESHYLTILHWARKDAENEQKGKKSYTGFWED